MNSDVQEATREGVVHEEEVLVDVVHASEATTLHDAGGDGRGIERIVVGLRIAPGGVAHERAYDIGLGPAACAPGYPKQVATRREMQVIEVGFTVGGKAGDRQLPAVPVLEVDRFAGAQTTLEHHIPAMCGRVSADLPGHHVGGAADIAAHSEVVTLEYRVRGVIIWLAIGCRWERNPREQG